jgi:hypothetical protein
MSWLKVLINPKNAGAVSKTISKVVGKYNIGNANKIKNNAAKANLESEAFNFKQTTKKFKAAVDKLGTKK